MAHVPVAMAFDDNYALPGWITVNSLLETAAPETCYHVFVLRANNISGLVQGEIAKLFTSTRHRLDFIEISTERFKNVKTGWSGVSTYFRLILHEYITQYDHVIWTDVDVLIKQDLSAVTAFDMSQSYWAGVGAEPNAPGYIFHGFYPKNTNTHNFMPGFMLVNLKKMREDRMSEVFFKALENYRERLPFYDLTILNLCCPGIVKLPIKYCVLERLYPSINRHCTDYRNVNYSYDDEEIVEAVRNPAIVHFAGFPIKIWKRHYWHIPQFYRSQMDRCPFYQPPSLQELFRTYPSYVTREIKREWKYVLKDWVKRIAPKWVIKLFKAAEKAVKFLGKGQKPPKPIPNLEAPLTSFAYMCRDNDCYAQKVFGSVMRPSVWDSEIFGFSPDLELIFFLESDDPNRTSLYVSRVFGAGFAAEEGKYKPFRDKITEPIRTKWQTMVYAIRGKLSKERIQKLSGVELHPSCVLADGALLVSSLLTAMPDKNFRVGIALQNKGQAASLGRQPNSLVLNENLPHMEYLRQIAQCETLVSDCLLPLVIADSLGIPNLWIGDSASYTHADYYSAYSMDIKPFPFALLVGDIPALVREHNRVPEALVRAKIEELKICFDTLKKDIIRERMS